MDITLGIVDKLEEEIELAREELGDLVSKLIEVIKENECVKGLENKVEDSLNKINLSDTKTIDNLKEKCVNVRNTLRTYAVKIKEKCRYILFKI